MKWLIHVPPCVYKTDALPNQMINTIWVDLFCKIEPSKLKTGHSHYKSQWPLQAFINPNFPKPLFCPYNA